VFPHPGDWTEAGVVGEAFALNSPLITVGAAPGGGARPAEFGFLEGEGSELALGALKLAEDGQGVIVRLYEPHGARGTATLRFASRVQRAERINLLEEPEGSVDVRDGEILVDVGPFEVLTLRVEPVTG
jgi:alpha-mannosidase